jgi:hypothetical protein
VPRWATRGLVLSINGPAQALNAEPGSSMTLRGTWRPNGPIPLRIPFTSHLAPVTDQTNVASNFQGPVLLADEESGTRSDWRPITLDADNLAKSIAGDPATLRFTVDGVSPEPFLDAYGHYSV